MKLTVNIREFIEDNADHNDMLLVHAGVDVGDLFETNCIPEEQEIDVDLDEILAANRQIAHVWGVKDVREIRPDLDDAAAWDVLRAVAHRLHYDVGITWDVVESVAAELFPKKPERHWQGRIDVRITDTDGYGQDEVITRLHEMADLIAGAMPDVKADFDPGAIRVLDSEETAGNEEVRP